MDQLAQLGINPWSMVLYIGNMGALLVFLTYFLYKPLQAFLEKRRQYIKDSLEQAENLKYTFEKTLQENEASKVAMEAELKSELEKLKRYIDERRAELNAEMETARAQMMERAQAEIDARKADMVKEVEDELKALMVRMVLHIVENKVPQDVIESSVQSAWKSYKK